MSWFSFTDIAKNALSEAQKKIDKALDIQGRENVQPDANTKPHVGPKIESVKDASKRTEPAAGVEVNPVKRAEFSSKKKNKPARLGGSALAARKLSSTDVTEDFFSILNDVNTDVTPKRPVKRSTSNDSFSEIQLTPPNQSASLVEKDVRKSIQNDLSTVTVAVTLDDTPAPETSKSNQEAASITSLSLESSYSDVALTVSSEGTMISESDAQNLSDDNEQPLESEHPEEVSRLGEAETDSGSLQQCADATQEEPLKSVSFDEVSADRTVSPSSSTAASSEIDILDHESTTSEVSSTSKVTDYQNFIQSPIHIPNIDAVDSDASQALSPIPDDGDNNTAALAASPPRICNEKPFSESVHFPIANHTVHPAANLPSDSIVQQSNKLEEMTASVTGSARSSPDSGQNMNSVMKTELGENKIEIIGDRQKLETCMSEQSKYVALSEKLEIYEQQLLNLSCKNAQLNEENDNLRTEITRTKELCENESEQEIQRVLQSAETCENNNKLLKEERSNLTKQIAVLKGQLASRMTNEQVQNAITEKEESIKGLMEEGEALSKKHLQQNNLIKKLKSAAQEREADLKNVKEKLEKFEEENKVIKEELLLLRGQGEEEREASLRISDAYEQRERQTFLLQERLSEAEEKQRTLQVNLDIAYKEIGDLHKQRAEIESKAKSEWVGREESLRRETDIEIKKVISEQEHQRQLLMLQMYELNNAISRNEAMMARKEDDHRRELREFQQQVQDSEARNQDLSDSVSSATRPLLRQIENLQATHSSQQRSWNALEKTLNSRLGEAQAELLAAQENERLAQSAAMNAKSKTLAYEKTIENDKKNLAKQEQEIDSLKKQVASLKGEAVSLNDELCRLQETHKETVDRSRKERLSLENQLQMEKVRAEAERKKYLAQQEALQREKDRAMWSRSEITSVSSNQVTETESVGSSNDAFHAADLLEKQLSSSSLPGLATRSFEASRPLSMSNILENLQTQLKLRDGEIAQLRGEINMLERTRSSMAEEIVRLTNLNEDMDDISKQLDEAKSKLAEVEARYTAILTMYGEKEEENEELKMDLEDVKAMYKQQINELLKPEGS